MSRSYDFHKLDVGVLKSSLILKPSFNLRLLSLVSTWLLGRQSSWVARVAKKFVLNPNRFKLESLSYFTTTERPERPTKSQALLLNLIEP